MSNRKANVPPSRGGGKPSGVRSEPRRPSDSKKSASKHGGLQSWFSASAIRELIEAVVIAFSLAFFVRTFEAEAFVIPTGSMAPTLMGRHKDLVCARCGYSFQVTASAEVNNETGQMIVDKNGRQWQHIVAGTCPNCRFPMDLAPGNPQGKTYRSFKGDRIFVAKFPYHLSDPDRWDVAVFAYPGKARMNYIKRLVGKPDETLLIRRGDIFTKPKGSEQFQIERKPPAKIVAMMQTVHNNDYVAPDLLRSGWPLRWGADPGVDRAGAWQTSESLKSFHTDGTLDGEAWLDYRHYTPTDDDWKTVLQGGSFDVAAGYPKPQLITDFVAYNTEVGAPQLPLNPTRLGLHWVGDLVLECTLRVESNEGKFLMALVQGGRIFQCELDVATGTATLFVDGARPLTTVAQDCVRGPGNYNLRFANVDAQLVLWVGGRVVQFDPKPEYDPRVDPVSRRAGRDGAQEVAAGESSVGSDPVPNDEDLRPARIGSRGLAATVSRLRLFRDVYYIATRADSGRGNGGMSDYDVPPEFTGNYPLRNPTAESEAALFSDPKQWSFFRYRREVSFVLEADQFFMLGDNGAESKDGRLWETDLETPYYVRRDLLKGKAVWIYWPHSWDRIPGTDKVPGLPNGIWFPLFPNFPRMGFVR